MKIRLNALYVFLGTFLFPVFANASFYSDEYQSCYTDDVGCDEFWYCGAPRDSDDHECYDNKPWGCDDEYFYIHGDKFSRNGTVYWCCNGTSSKTGQWKSGSNWIVKTETVTEVFSNGRCTWEKKTNICGDVDNPADQCTEPTPCEAGTVWHAKQCAPMCGEGEAYQDNSSINCIPCETNDRQGIVKNVCKKCELNEYFSKTKLKCVKYSDMTQISTLAHEECWLCSTPGAMWHCLNQVSANGRITDTKLQRACSIDAKTSDASGFNIPDNYGSASVQLIKALKPLTAADNIIINSAAAAAAAGVTVTK